MTTSTSRPASAASTASRWPGPEAGEAEELVQRRRRGRSRARTGAGGSGPRPGSGGSDQRVGDGRSGHGRTTIAPASVATRRPPCQTRRRVRAEWSRPQVPSAIRRRVVSRGSSVADAGDELAEVAAGEGPLERRGDLVVVALEGVQALDDALQAGEVVRRQDLALDDREVDLDLVEPGGVDRQVDEHEVRPLAPGGARRERLAAVRGAVVDDPEHAPRAGVGLGWS